MFHDILLVSGFLAVGLTFILFEKQKNRTKALQKEVIRLTEINDKLRNQERDLQTLQHEKNRIHQKMKQLIKDHISKYRKSKDLTSTCLICYEEDVSMTVQIPCGHVYSCRDCSERYQTDECYICRKPIYDIYNIYFLMEPNKIEIDF